MTIQVGDKIALKHGHCSEGKVSPIYQVWGGMVKRCSNSKHKDYARYGGRGITVCDRWLKFENFLEDMGPRPEGLELDRTDNNGDYEPSNCRWISHKENCINRRSTNMICFRGETLCLSDWAKTFGISQSTLWRRIHQRGWSIERALTVSSRKWQRRVGDE